MKVNIIDILIPMIFSIAPFNSSRVQFGGFDFSLIPYYNFVNLDVQTGSGSYQILKKKGSGSDLIKQKAWSGSAPLVKTALLNDKPKKYSTHFSIRI